MIDIPQIESCWRHKSGQIYLVVLVTNTNADENKKDEYPVTICYRRLRDSTVWSRSLSRWHESFTEIK